MAGLVDIPSNPVPRNTFCDSVRTPDGVNLRYARFPPNRSPVRGTIIVVHGRTEFIEKYFETVNDLRRRGFAVLVFDARGQGGSDRLLTNRRKGHVRDFADYVIRERARRNGCEAVATFDKTLLKERGFVAP